MENFLKKGTNRLLLGLAQALGVASYTAGVGAFMYNSADSIAPSYLGIFLFLTLFVFSAAVTGTLVFGIPVYLVFNKKLKEGLFVLFYTLLFSFLILVSVAALTLI